MCVIEDTEQCIMQGWCLMLKKEKLGYLEALGVVFVK